LSCTTNYILRNYLHLKYPQTLYCFHAQPQTIYCFHAQPQTIYCFHAHPQTIYCFHAQPQTIYCFHAQPQTIYCYVVKVHQYRFICQVEVALTRVCKVGIQMHRYAKSYLSNSEDTCSFIVSDLLT